MPTLNPQKTAAAGGILFVVATVISVVIVSPPPGTDESAAKFLAYYSDNRTVLLIQMIIGLVALVPAFFFIAGFSSLLRRDEGDAGILGITTLVAYSVAVAVIVVATGWVGALAFLADGNGLEEGTARTLSLLGTGVCTSGIFAAVAAGDAASAYALLAGKKLPKWLGWVGLAAAVLALLGICSVAKSGPFEPFGFFSFAAFVSFLIYVLLTSVFMWLRSE